MAAVLAQMRGDAVGAGLDRDKRRAHRIRPRARPRVAQGGDVIDIDSEAQRRSWHGLAADDAGHDVMRGLDPRIHLLEKMDCRVKPGNDELYPLTRSTRATTALARNWAIIALRCFRS